MDRKGGPLLKRTILGFALLIGLLVLGIFTAGAMERRHTPISFALEKAADSAAAENWDRAGMLLGEAKALWDRGWQADAALADHAPMEEIDGLFARLLEFRREEDKEEFTAGCRELSRLVKAMTDAHTPSWWNLL